MDVAAMVDELSERILGGFVGKAYQQSSDKIWLTIQSPAEGRLDLLLEAGKRAHITQQSRPASKTPPQFPTMLRGHLSGGRVVDVTQYDFDRVLEIAVERAGQRSYLIVELFPKGSMVLLDSSRRILSMLRKMVFRGRKMAAGELYLFHPGQEDPRTVTSEELSRMLSSSSQDLIRTLVRGLNMAGIYGEEVCLRAGLDKNKPAAALDESEIARISQSLSQVFADRTLDPHIVILDSVPFDVLPRPLRVYEHLEVRRFATFSQALDAFFVVEEVETAKPDPLDRRIEIQKRAIADFEDQEKELTALGELIYREYGQVEAILKVLAEARSKGFSYNQIWEKISASGHPHAQTIRSLDGLGQMTIVLDGRELKIDARLTVPQNAGAYYEQAKEMNRKAAGARAALAATMQLKAAKAEPRKPKAARVFRRRKPKWYERFRWFHSSDGFLVIGGRDAEGNEEIYAKYLEKRDLALHTDAPGAPLTVIKTEGRDVPESTMEEAAQFAVSYSSVWKAGMASGDCYLVKGDQVSKTPEPGEFLRKGGFVIRGERRYFRDVGVGLAIGIHDLVLIGGPVSAVKQKADPVLEILPGEFNPDDLAKRIYRYFADKIEDRATLKAIASVDQIVMFLPPGGSMIKES